MRTEIKVKNKQANKQTNKHKQTIIFVNNSDILIKYIFKVLHKNLSAQDDKLTGQAFYFQKHNEITWSFL